MANEYLLVNLTPFYSADRNSHLPLISRQCTPPPLPPLTISLQTIFKQKSNCLKLALARNIPPRKFIELSLAGRVPPRHPPLENRPHGVTAMFIPRRPLGRFGETTIRDRRENGGELPTSRVPQVIYVSPAEFRVLKKKRSVGVVLPGGKLLQCIRQTRVNIDDS